MGTIFEFMERHFSNQRETIRPNMNGVLVEMDIRRSSFDREHLLPQTPSAAKTAFDKESMHLLKEFSLCEELSGASSVEMTNNIFMVNREGMVIEPATIRIEKGMRFEGKAIFISVNTSSAYGGGKVHKPVYKGACITPIVYSPEDFTPRRKMVIEYSPEGRLDDRMFDRGKGFRQYMHELLDQMIDFPEIFVSDPELSVTARGYFEKVTYTKEENVKREVTMSLDASLEKDSELTVGMGVIFGAPLMRQTGGGLQLNSMKYYIPIPLCTEIMRELPENPRETTREMVEAALVRRGRYDIIEFNRSVKKAK